MDKKVLLIILLFLCVNLYGCSKVNKVNSIYTVTGEVINIEATSVISRHVKIKTNNGKEIIVRDTFGAIGDVDLGTKISVQVDEGNYVSGDIEYYWEE